MKNARSTQGARESKHRRFVRVVERRTNETLERIRILSNCSNRNTYSYSDKEVTAVFAELGAGSASGTSKVQGTWAQSVPIARGKGRQAGR